MTDYKNKSLVDVAYDILSGHDKPIKFKDLYDEVAPEAGLLDDRKAALISNFFTNLSLDGRFVALKNNEWDLRSRQTFDKVHVDLNAIYEDIEEGDKDTSDPLDDDEDEDDKILRGDGDDEDEDESYYKDNSSDEIF